jgi:perosamine synthetase
MLAADGGEKVRTKPFPARNLFGEEEKQAALALFDQSIQSGNAFGYGGPEEQAYEKEFSEFLGGGFADLVNSGTTSVFVALGALELDVPGEVVIPPITDPGGAMPIALQNLVPMVADAAPGSFNAGADEIEAVLTEHTRAIVVAHIAGEPADMGPIMELAKARDLPVIEDCAQAHGAKYRGEFVGTMGALGAFSTMSGKHHATGAQGGVVFTKDEELYWRVKRYSDRGKPLNTDATSNVRASLNMNGNDLAAAIGRVQLRKLGGITERRRKAAEGIRSGISQLKAISLGRQAPDSEAVYWFMRFHVDAAKLSTDKAGVVKALAAEGIPCTLAYRHIPSEAIWFKERKVFGSSDYPWGLPDYKGDRNATFPCPNAVEATDSHFTMPVHENYGEEEVADIVKALEKVEKAYLK